MQQAEMVIIGLLVAVTGLSALARWLSVPYPIVLVVGGALFGFVPGVPTVHLNPNVVLVVFLPPLVYGSAFFADLGQIRANVGSVTLVTVGLVLVTMAAVAAVAHVLIPGMSLAAAATLGAIVAPTDPVAAAIVMRRLEVPRGLVAGVESEGLLNDATALVAYKVALGALVGGTFSIASAGLHFVAAAAGGVAIGLAVGFVIAQLRARIDDAHISITISLLSGYAAYIPADAIGASGVLAVATAGIYLGVRGPRIISARTRLQGFFVWDVLDFILNASLFALIGLQLRTIVEGLSAFSPLALAGYALAVAGAVSAVRLAWFFTVPYAIRALDRATGRTAQRLSAQARAVIAWSGMRGSVSLAVAIALPLHTKAGAPLPQRDLIVFLTFAVIFSTLVLQGLSLPALIRRLHIADDGTDGDEELRARMVATKAALAQIDQLAGEQWTRDDTVERMRGAYEYRKRRLSARAGKIEDDGYEDRSLAYQQMVQIVLGAQRDALVRLRDEHGISNEVMNRVVRELDLEESRLEI